MNPLVSALSQLNTLDYRWLLEEGYYNSVVNTLHDKPLAEYFAQLHTSHKPPPGTVQSGPAMLRGLSSQRLAVYDPEEKPYAVRNGIAIVAISGPLTKEFSWLSYYYGGTSTTDALLAVQIAGQDPDVKGILLLVYSPGGQVAGTFDLADEIALVGAVKPVYAYVSDLCASAAYAVAVNATKILANRTALVGSIGTYMVLRDFSKMYEDAGIKTEVIRAGQYKGAGVAGTSLTKEQRQEFQRNTDSLNFQFLQTVQVGRDLSDDAIADLADGRCWVGQEAADLGLVDGICSLDATLDALQSVCASRQRVVW